MSTQIHTDYAQFEYINENQAPYGCSNSEAQCEFCRSPECQQRRVDYDSGKASAISEKPVRKHYGSAHEARASKKYDLIELLLDLDSNAAPDSIIDDIPDEVRRAWGYPGHGLIN